MSNAMCVGPRPNTVGDFWKMVWQDKVTHIIMLTNLVEGKKVGHACACFIVLSVLVLHSVGCCGSDSCYKSGRERGGGREEGGGGDKTETEGHTDMDTTDLRACEQDANVIPN